MSEALAASKRFFPISLLAWLVATAAAACNLGLRLAGMSASFTPSGFQAVYFVVEQLAYFPLTLVKVNAFILLYRRRNAHPIVSKYALLALSGLFADWVFTSALAIWMVRAQPATDSANLLWMIRMCVSGLLVAFCWWLLMLALLGWREGRGEGEESSYQ